MHDQKIRRSDGGKAIVALLVIALVTIHSSALAAALQVAATSGQTFTLPDFVHEVWTTRDGLPVNSINDVVQTRDGYIWAATFDGLVRFDGVRFTVYRTGTFEGLPSNRITTLHEARDGTLWLLTEQRHLVRWRDGTFVHIAADHGFEDRLALALLEDGDGVIWVGTDRGFGAIRGDRFEPVAERTITAPVEVLASAAGVLWVGTRGSGTFRYSAAGVEEVLYAGNRLGRINGLYPDADGSVWLLGASALFRYEDGELTRFAWPDSPVYLGPYQALRSPTTGSLWLNSTAGIYRLGPEGPTRILEARGGGGRLQTLTVDSAGRVWFATGSRLYREGLEVYSLETPDVPASHTRIRAHLVDHEGSVWIGTDGSGLHRLKPALFKVYAEEQGIPHRTIYPILQAHSGTMVIGTWGGGLSTLSSDGVVTNHGSLGGPSLILSLFEDATGRLWVGAYNGGVQVCDIRQMRCTRPDYPPLRYAHVYAIHHDQTGRVWIGDGQGIVTNDDAGWTRRDPEAGAPSSPARVFLEAQDGSLWIGTNGEGLFRYQSGRFTRYGVSDGLPSDLIRSLYEDEDGCLWVGTEGRGLARLAPAFWQEGTSPRHVVVYRGSDGLFDDVIHQILEDDFGRLWMSTNRGIFWVSRAELNAFAEGETQRIHSTGYTERDGLRNREANGGFQPAGIKASDGRIWFPTQDGAAVVDPSRLVRNEVTPPVVIEQVITGDRLVAPDSDGFVLEPSERDLQIDYTALSFLAPENVRFRYKLDPFNESWVEAGNRRTAFYTNIPPGEYTFRVIASNNDGVWNAEGAAIALSLTPRFYETTAWYVLLAAVLLVLTLTAVHWRLRSLRLRERRLSLLVDERTHQLRSHEAQLQRQNTQLEAQAQQLERLDRAKSRFFANISHEFRTPLTLTIGPLEDIRSGLHGDPGTETSRRLDVALLNARRMLRLINQILDVAKLESGETRLRARQADLVPFAHKIAVAFVPVAERKRIEFRTELPPHVVTAWFDPDALEKVLANLLSNAFKFTPERGKISFSLEVGPHGGGGRAIIRVSDSGPGIPRAELDHIFERFYQTDEAHPRSMPGTGIGLSLAKELTELHGGEVRVHSHQAAGTTFEVHLPLGRAHLADDQIVVSPDEARKADADWVGALHPERALMKTDVSEPEPDDEPEDVPTVLVVDDNADIRAYVRSHLERRYRVREAADGRQGLALARSLIPDLVISDVMMPDMDGKTLCRALRSSPDTDFVPVILLTARAATEDRVAGLDEGADDYIVKPFDEKVLMARVANLIASRKLLRERFAAGRIELRAASENLTAADAAYLETVRQTIETNLSDGDFGVAELARAVAQDRSHLYRRLRELVGESPRELIRRVRLERAAHLLEGEACSIAEVAYSTGFNSVSYFCKCFKEAYELTPSAYRDAVPHA